MRKILAFLFRALSWLSLLGVCCLLVAALFAEHILVHVDPPEKVDAIVVLGGSFSRPFHAADLYNQGFAPVIYVSRVARNGQLDLLDQAGIPYPREEDVYAQVLMQRGVPRNAIRFFGPGNVSTRHEAMELSAILPRNASIMLVTSPPSTRRQGLIFREHMPGATILVQASPYIPFVRPWWTDRESAKLVGTEMAKLLFHFLDGSFSSDP